MDVQTVIQIDSREQWPLEFNGYETEVIGLPVGDYGIRGFSDWTNPAFIVERKSIDDLVGSLTSGRERFDREIEKMRAFRFHALLIEGAEAEVELSRYRSCARPQSILQSIAAYQVRTNLHVVWAGDRNRAARWLERAVRQFCRGVMKDAKRLENAQREAATAAA